MKALTFDIPEGKAEPHLKIVDAPVPTPGKAEVLVRITHVALSHIDYENQRGWNNKALRKNLKKSPVVSGIEMAGIVESNGTKFKKGDPVFGYTNIFKGPWFHAEYVALAETNLASIPHGVSAEGATAIIGGALTAITALEKIAGTQNGDDVLITGATGSVGITALHLALHLGAEVTAVCHSSQVEFARSQGAREVMAYDLDEPLPKGTTYNTVFDTAPSLGFLHAKPFLKRRGTYVTTMPHLDVPGAIASMFSFRKWGFLLESNTDEKRLGRLSTLMAEGVFAPAVDSTYAFADAAQAFERQRGRGRRGKIILRMEHT
ncbi:MAG: NAD(P)-dependent alcohol dehydrogenase [Rhodobiaceae bacterium]|nr:NAD(P)-dependent alcohol dehydrogenase [Rhodobiaceae bacterium]